MESMPPPPKHTEVKRPTGEPPQSWRNVPTINGSTDIDSAEQHTTAKENLPAQARENTVEEKRGSKKHGRASQSRTTRVPTTTSEQSTAPKQVEWTPKKGRVSWKEPLVATVIIRGDFQGINRGKRKLRTRTAAEHEATPKTLEINPATATTSSINPIAQDSQVKPDYNDINATSNQRTNHEMKKGQRAFPAKLAELIKEIRQEEIPAPMPPEFIFKLTEEAAEKNFLILKNYNFDLEKAIRAQQSSPLGYGSEFRSPEMLRKIFKHHLLWARMKDLLTDGSKWPLSELNKSERIADLTEALAFGNHKGASRKPVILKKLITDDIRYGNGLVIPQGKISHLPNACVAPMNIMNQFTLDAGGEIVDKEHLTHDQSFKWQSGFLVNRRVKKESLQCCMYGCCLMRLLCWIVAARRKVPRAPIALQKIDIKSAYRRCHLHAITAMQTITQLSDNNLGIIMLRLTFGGTPCPFEWNILSESIRNLANKILFDNNWDPQTDYAPSQHLVPAIEIMDASIPFAEGADLIVDIPVDPRGIGDVYIDDLIQATIVINGTDKSIQCKHATLLAIDTCARPKHPDEPIPHKDMKTRNKLQAEAGSEEQKTVLGWFLDTRQLLVQLPKNKFIAWTNLINMVIQQGKTMAKEVKRIIRCLGHLGMAIPFIHHFLSRLRNLQARAKSRRSIPINEECRKDLELMIHIIKIAHNGISMNSIIYQWPMHVYRSDSYPAGLGGYSGSGFAWQYYLKPGHQFWATNNLLEHIATIITPWVVIIRGRLHPGACALSMTDSTTSEGWLRKTNFSKLNNNPIQATV
jgi:hypothetical protein